MKLLTSFIHRYLDPADRLGEVLFGLIMALGFTGAVRLGHEEADSRALFVGILGCNLAWAIVDGVMYTLTSLFERGRKARLAREVRKASTDELALQQIGAELDGPLMELTTPQERVEVHRWVLEVLRRGQPEAPGVRREDLLGAVAVALVIAVATLPMLLPYLLFPNPSRAVRISEFIGLTQLFLLGLWWGRVVGAKPFRIAVGLTVLGMLLVLITLVLGG
jgi:VIT1/CCC1 family predicted Fe2+/Mn2+ transporter